MIAYKSELGFHLKSFEWTTKTFYSQLVFPRQSLSHLYEYLNQKILGQNISKL